MIDAPTWWQTYLIAGTAYSSYVVGNSGFEPRYREWLAAQPRRVLSPNERVAVGVFAVSFCTALWVPILLVALVKIIWRGCR